MFVQVIIGNATDANGLLAEIDRWDAELRSGANGFLGSTSGVSGDGRFVLIARFATEEAARRNSARPEQASWWARASTKLRDVEIHDSATTMLRGGGGSNDAGFVQVMRGRIRDASTLAAAASRAVEIEASMRRFRPDLVGGLIATHADDSYTNINYFTSEDEARRAEATEPPADVEEMFALMSAATTVDEYIDLSAPRFS